MGTVSSVASSGNHDSGDHRDSRKLIRFKSTTQKVPEKQKGSDLRRGTDTEMALKFSKKKKVMFVSVCQCCTSV